MRLRRPLMPAADDGLGGAGAGAGAAPAGETVNLLGGPRAAPGVAARRQVEGLSTGCWAQRVSRNPWKYHFSIRTHHSAACTLHKRRVDHRSSSCPMSQPGTRHRGPKPAGKNDSAGKFEIRGEYY